VEVYVVPFAILAYLENGRLETAAKLQDILQKMFRRIVHLMAHCIQNFKGDAGDCKVKYCYGELNPVQKLLDHTTYLQYVRSYEC
jgi:hypothetical protein